MKIKLNKFLKEKTFVRIEREVNGAELDSLYGFVLKFSDNLILVQIEYDFLLDGFAIIRMQDVKRITSDASQKYIHKILKKERIISDLFVLPNVDLTNWQLAFKSIRKTFEFLIVEGEDPQVDEFLIGKIKRTNKDTLSFRHFDATGKWESTNTIAPYKDISRIKLDTRYTNIITKYIKGTA